MRAATWGASARAALMAVLAIAWPAQAQTLAYQAPDRGPRFLLASAHSTERAPVDVARTPILKRRLSLSLDGATLKQALAEISLQSGLQLVYSDNLFPDSGRVHLRTDGLSVAAALTEVLLDADIDVVFESGLKAALVRRSPRAQVGTIVGRVTDVRSGEGLPEALVRVEGANLSASTGADGSYRVPNVAPNTYGVSVRRIGYVRQTRQVTVVADEEVTADFALEPAPTRLDELVTVTPGGMQTQLKALPTPVTVITADEIASQHPLALADVIRQSVPSAAASYSPSLPIFTNFSARGASSISGSSAMKIFVNGVEATNFGFAAVDPASIERIEVTRGPQATALYGADAAGGVVQIFTKRGDPSLTRPQVDLQAEGGVAQTPYAGFGGVLLRQDYAASVSGGGARGTVNYHFGGGYTRLPDWVPNGELSRMESGSLYGGVQYTDRIFTADLHARYYPGAYGTVTNPVLAETGFPFFSRPTFQRQNYVNETYGARFTVAPTLWWRNSLTLGIDRQLSVTKQAQPRLTTPEDTLLALIDVAQGKTSVGFNTALTGALGTGIGGSLTAGIDHYNADVKSFITFSALNTIGPIQTSPPGALEESRTTTTNTGYFAQAEVNWRDAVFLTAGVRAEQNSSFGQDLETPIAPRIGLAAVHQFGRTTIKARAAYGRAIRAPLPLQALGGTSTFAITTPNPLLAPERQRGWDAGIDLVFGDRGSLSITGYHQTAENLVTRVQVANDPPLPTFQYQNLGEVANSGVEVEGALTPARWIRLKAQYGYARSRVEDLGGATIGTIEVGDPSLGTPTHTAGATLTLTPWEGTTLTTGLTYVGSLRSDDFVALIRCFAATGPCPPDFDFVVTYPGFERVTLAITQRITPQLEGLLSINNLTNDLSFDRTNIQPVMGRITMVGFHFRY